MRAVAAMFCVSMGVAAHAATTADPGKPPTTAEVMESAAYTDWRRPDPANTLYLELASGRVVIELSPRFAPQHVANIKQLVAEKFFDNLTVVRVQDNFVAQWGDPEKTRPTPSALRKLPDEMSNRLGQRIAVRQTTRRGRLRARDRMDRRNARGGRT
jgi:peptidylprolyl isomerase